jgi:type II restriction enzyme
MIELDAAQVLTFPQVFKAREVVRRGFLSNLLFANVGGIFRFSEHVKDILEKLPKAKEGKTKKGTIDIPQPAPVTDRDGNVQVDKETVINPKVDELGPPVWSVEEMPKIESDTTASKAAAELAKFVTEKAETKREELKEAFGLTQAQVDRDVKRTEQDVKARVERAFVDHNIAQKHLDDDKESAATEAEATEVEARRAVEVATFKEELAAIVSSVMDTIVPDVVEREVTKVEQKQANDTMNETRDHLRGFARTIPMFLMAYGHRDMRLSNFDDYTDDHVFEEVTGITEAEFRVLRDGQEIVGEDGMTIRIPGLFDEAVFNESIQEFLNKKVELADYFDDAHTEDIFAYIPQQKTSLVFTPKAVVKQMVDILETENPGIFSDPDKTFADLFSTAGLFLMELVRRLDTGFADQIPDQNERLRHILTSQVFEMSHNQILHHITVEAVSGGDPERKAWITNSGHFKVGNLAKMSPEERQKTLDEMLTEGN